MNSLSLDSGRERSRGEEISNSVSHGVGLVAALVATPFLVVRAVQHNHHVYAATASIFAACVLLLYLGSTLYHSLPPGKAKLVFRVIEQSAIYFLIAGTYTPVALTVLGGALGWTLFAMEWGLAIFGVTLRLTGKISNSIISVGIYLLMGLLILFAIDPMMARVPTAGLQLLAIGGLAYLVGLVFFAADVRMRYGHFLWHLFVLAGTTCHYFAVLWYMV